MSNIEQLKADTASAWDRLRAANKETDRLRHEWCLLRDELEVAEAAAAEEAKNDVTEKLVDAIDYLLTAAEPEGRAIAINNARKALKLARGEW